MPFTPRVLCSEGSILQGLDTPEGHLHRGSRIRTLKICIFRELSHINDLWVCQLFPRFGFGFGLGLGLGLGLGYRTLLNMSPQEDSAVYSQGSCHNSHEFNIYRHTAIYMKHVMKTKY